MNQTELFDTSPPEIGEVEERLRARGVTTIVGVDEAGRGPLAGPVVAGAYWLDLREPFPTPVDKLDDSKKLTEPLREEYFDALCPPKHRFAVASSSASIVDEINVLQATFRAMHQAVSELVEAMGQTPDRVLVDGNMTIPKGLWDQQAIVKGDGRSFAIAAASILAKVTRDRFMRQAHRRWSQYGFDSHKGYGTAQHREALRKYGPCELHRRSFGGVVIDDE
jgi:ribonuclease HII